MSRERLPNRRYSEVISFWHDGQKYHGSIGYFMEPEPHPGEVFLDASKPGSPMQAMARDWAVTASLVLQHNCSLDTLRGAMTRDDAGEPSGPGGKLLDLVEREGGVP